MFSMNADANSVIPPEDTSSVLKPNIEMLAPIDPRTLSQIPLRKALDDAITMDPAKLPSLNKTPRMLEPMVLPKSETVASIVPSSFTPLNTISATPIVNTNVEQVTDEVINIDDSMISGPGALVCSTALYTKDLDNIGIHLIDSADDGYIITAINNENGHEYFVPFPSLSQARRLCFSIDVSDDVFEELGQHLVLIGDVGGPLQLKFQQLNTVTTEEAMLLYTSDKLCMNGINGTVECYYHRQLCVFVLKDVSGNEVASLQTTKYNVLNLNLGNHDLVISNEIGSQMAALIPSLIIHKKSSNEKQELALYHGTYCVTVSQEMVAMTLIEYENEILCSIFDVKSMKERVVLISGWDWLSFRSQLHPHSTPFSLYSNLASRLIKLVDDR